MPEWLTLEFTKPVLAELTQQIAYKAFALGRRFEIGGKPQMFISEGEKHWFAPRGADGVIPGPGDAKEGDVWVVRVDKENRQHGRDMEELKRLLVHTGVELEVH